MLVYPGCRVASPEVEFDSKGYRWDKGTIRTENLHEVDDTKVDQRSDDQPDDVAPGKQEYSLDVSGLSEFEIPTIWFDRPTSILASQGVIKLDGGEIIVFGEGALFQLESIGPKFIVLKWQGKDLQIPVSKVVSIVPAQN